jgi:molybdopterin synthase catalytic subunit
MTECSLVPAPTTVRVLLFAVARDRVGSDSVELAVPRGCQVKDLRSSLAEQYPSLGGLLRNMRLAVNAEYVGDESHVPEGAEIAVIPPVSGG